MFKYWMEIVHNRDNGYLDWLFHQNVFLCESQLPSCMSTAKDSYLRNYLEAHGQPFLAG